MRWYIIRTLIHKEVLRHLANRGGIVLAVLLVGMAMLLSIFGKSVSRAGGIGGAQFCFVDFWEGSPWIGHLSRNVPTELQGQIYFRPAERVPTDAQGVMQYPINGVAIQIRVLEPDEKGPRYKVWMWYPGQDRNGLAPYEAWFWRETHHFFQQRTAAALTRLSPQLRAAVPLPNIEEEYSALNAEVDPRTWIAAFLVLSPIYIACIYLLPSFTCEERERGILLAQALSPATAEEIIAAKIVFYLLAGMILAAIVAGTYQPRVLLRPFFWMALGATTLGSVGVGLAIASLARTQRAASMGALCYMLVVTLLMFICKQTNIPGLSNLALEYHGPQMLHAAMTNLIFWFHWWHLAGATILAIVWSVLAIELFRRRGWQ